MTNKLPVVGQRYRMIKEVSFVVEVFDVSRLSTSFGIPNLFSLNWYIESFWEAFEELPEEPTSTDMLNEQQDLIGKAHSLVDSQKAEEVQLDENVNSVQEKMLKSIENIKGAKFMNEVKEELSGNINSIEVALEELKELLINFNFSSLPNYGETLLNNSTLKEINNKTQNLVNALEAEKKQPTIMGVDIGEEGGDKTVYCLREGNKILRCSDKNPSPENKPNSLWKPVSELPKNRDGEIIAMDYKGIKHLIRTISIDNRWIWMTLTNEETDSNYFSKYCTLTDFINHQQSLADRIERLEKIMDGK